MGRLDYKCCEEKCGMALLNPKPVDLVSPKPELGDILLCGMCGMINIVDLMGTRKITDDELLNLSVEERRDLDFAVRAIKKQGRN